MVRVTIPADLILMIPHLEKDQSKVETERAIQKVLLQTELALNEMGKIFFKDQDSDCDRLVYLRVHMKESPVEII